MKRDFRALKNTMDCMIVYFGARGKPEAIGQIGGKRESRALLARDIKEEESRPS